jgi:hypothetical protein
MFERFAAKFGTCFLFMSEKSIPQNKFDAPFPPNTCALYRERHFEGRNRSEDYKKLPTRIRRTEFEVDNTLTVPIKRFARLI